MRQHLFPNREQVNREESEGLSKKELLEKFRVLENNKTTPNIRTSLRKLRVFGKIK